MHKIVPATGRQADAGKKFNKSTSSNVLGNQHASSKTNSLTAYSSLNREAAMAQGRSARPNTGKACRSKPAFPVRQGGVVVQHSLFMQQRAACQVFRFSQSTHALSVIGTANRTHGFFNDSFGDCAGISSCAVAQSSINPTVGQVDIDVAYLKTDIEIGEPRHQAMQPWCEPLAGEGDARAQREAGRCVTRAQPLGFPRQFRQRPADHLVQRRAFLGQCDAPGHAAEQPGAEILFQRLDLTADRSWSDIQFICRESHAQQTACRLEGAQGLQRWRAKGHRRLMVAFGSTINPKLFVCQRPDLTSGLEPISIFHAAQIMSLGTQDSTTPPLSALVGGLSLRSIGGMLLLAVLWGLSIPITKLGLESMPPIAFTALRFTFAVPFLFLFAIGRHRISLAALPPVAVLGVIGIGIGNLSQSFGVAQASASVSTIVSATIPVFIVLLAALRLGQSVSRVQQFGLAAAFAGVALVALGQDDAAGGLAHTTLTGVALILVSAITIAFYYVWSVELAARHGTIAVVIWSTLAGFIALLPFAALEVSATAFRVEPVAVASAIYLGLLVSAVGLFLWLWLLRTVPARIAASVQFLQPVFGIGASAVMFGDRMGPFFMAGVVLVLTGIALSIARRRTKPETNRRQY